MRTGIPLLQNVRVASPCRASWEEMTPIDQDRVRFCDGCRKRVYNLSALCQAEAEGLLRAHEGHLCVRYYRRHDGTILTTDCPVGLRAARQLVLTRTRVSAGLCMMLCLAFAAYNASMQTMGKPVSSVQVTPISAPPEVVPTLGTTTPPVDLHPLMGLVAVKPAPETNAELGDVISPAGNEMGVEARRVVEARTGRYIRPALPPAIQGETVLGKPYAPPPSRKSSEP